MKIDKIKLKEMREARVPQREIAKYFICSPAAVSKAIKRMELEKTTEMLINLSHQNPRRKSNDQRDMIREAKSMFWMVGNAIHDCHEVMDELRSRRLTLKRIRDILRVSKERGISLIR